MQKQFRLIPLAVACGVFALSGSAHAAVSRMDRNFMMNVAQINIAEVDGGHLAQTRAVNARVRDYGQKMIEDHSSANNDLKRLARHKGVHLPNRTDMSHRAMANRLAKFSGAPFDRAYMQAMAAGHQKAIAMFRSEVANGRDADVRAWAKKMLPALHMHLRMARDLATSHAVRTGAKM
jgi:putative membrane protein